MNSLKNWGPFFLRFVIGWHFLYEGIYKLASPGWSAEGFLKGSYGFLSGFYHSLASNDSIIEVVNFLNIWGLILIGIGLILGIFIKISSISGILLLLLYYFCYPPFGEPLFSNPEGHFWIVNRNLVEIFALLLIIGLPAKDYSLLRLIKKLKTLKPTDDQSEISEGRRSVLKGLAGLPFVGAVMYTASANAARNELDGSTGATMTLNTYNLNDLEGVMPKGKIGEHEISRLVMGCNLISGYAHSRDLHYVGSLFRHYNTEKKIYETFNLCEKAGVNTTNIVLSNFPFFNNYKKVTGSKMKTIAQVHVKPDEDDPLLQFKQARDYGATTMYIQGGCADQLVKNERLDWMEKALDFTRSQGMLAGVGGHSIQVVLASEKAGLNPDYYFKTVHHDQYWSAHPRENRYEFEVDSFRSADHNRFHDNIFDIFPEQTVEVFKNIKVPLFGFKVLAGGAIKPEDGFRYAFENGADFICVGMFDFQVVENVNLVNKILAGNLNRERKWYS
jgi:uncharacterized membrane protein YphA (DoxX/SURF4 family)